MEPFLQKLEHALVQFPEVRSGSSLVVAFSGGLDSTVLLAALTRLERFPRVRAVHIDHGLHPESEHWAVHCGRIAAQLDVAFLSRRVTVNRASRQGLEASAREVRYATLAEVMKPGELLLTAHHRDDQLETVLLRLLRGSGVKGLRGISPYLPFGPGFLGRPLLEMTREEIQDSANRWGLSWLEDPSNPDPRFDRNYLRHEVVPLLLKRWPGAGVTIGRAAQRMADAQEILDSVAVADATAVETPGRISQAYLRDLPSTRRANLLRYLIGESGLAIPTAGQLKQLLAAIDVTRPDAQTQVRWPGGEARVYRGQLYLFEPLEPRSEPEYEGRLDLSTPWQGPEGRLELSRFDGAGLTQNWVERGFTVRFRSGG
jgi:tRNA(Ile)-lysidine synthase